MTRIRSLAVLVCLCLVFVACGNTASKQAKSVSDSGDSGASVAGEVGGTDATVNTKARPEPAKADTAEAQQEIAAEEVAPGAGGKTSAGIVKVHGSGKGFTENVINVGIQLVVDTEAGFAAVGAGKGVAPDEPAIANTMVDWINKHGGIAGRKVNPIMIHTEALNGTWASQAEAACRGFTEDNKVVAAITSATGGSDALWACMSRKGTPLVERNSWLWDDPYYTARPNMLYTPPRMSPDRWIGHWLTGLKKTGFFKGKLGVARFDGEPFDRLTAKRLKPALRKLGVTITHEAILTSPPSIAAFGNMNGEISNAIVQMRSKQVDHVIFLQNAGILPFFWLPEADAQKWYPQYGLSTADIPLTLTGLSPESQLENAQGVSWMPPIDVPLQNDDPQRAKREKVCHDIYKSDPTFHNGSMCDAMLFLKFALDRATAISPDGLAAAVKRIGDTYQSNMTVSSFLNGSLYYDGAAGVRYFDWKTNCAVVDGQQHGCFKFTTGPIAARR